MDSELLLLVIKVCIGIIVIITIVSTLAVVGFGYGVYSWLN